MNLFLDETLDSSYCGLLQLVTNKLLGGVQCTLYIVQLVRISNLESFRSLDALQNSAFSP